MQGFISKTKAFFAGLFESIQDSQMRKAEAVRKYYENKWQ